MDTESLVGWHGLFDLKHDGKPSISGVVQKSMITIERESLYLTMVVDFMDDEGRTGTCKIVVPSREIRSTYFP